MRTPGCSQTFGSASLPSAALIGDDTHTKRGAPEPAGRCGSYGRRGEGLTARRAHAACDRCGCYARGGGASGRSGPSIGAAIAPGTESAVRVRSTTRIAEGSTAIGPSREAIASVDVSVVLRQEHDD